MFAPVGFGGATVKIAPPLVITEEAILESTAVSRKGFRSSMQVNHVSGGGMIAHDQILPSFYQLQRLGLVEQIVGVRAA